jgi:tetratricopeptide (TPR) repeat protein
MKTILRFPFRALFLLVLSLPFVVQTGETRDRSIATAPVILESDQQQVLRKEVLNYLRQNPGRKAGEGYLYLARFYHELDQTDRALEALQEVVRADPIDIALKYRAQLFMAKIFEDKKDYDAAIKELNRLLSWNPSRDVFIKTKIALATIWGRGMTRIEDLFKAYQRYFSKFPEVNEEEELKYLMGFERGYDLEIAMRGLEIWEEIARYPERDAADLGNLHVALFNAYDLGKQDRALRSLHAISKPPATEAATHSLFVQAALFQYHGPLETRAQAESFYLEFRQTTADLLGYRISTIMLGDLYSTVLEKHEEAIEVLASLASTPERLIATASLSLKKRQETEEEDRSWTILGLKMAGYIAEFRLNNPDRAKPLYEKATELSKKRILAEGDFWLPYALSRTEPKLSAPQMLFDKAFEKYRSRDIHTALGMLTTFVASFPDHELAREVKYRVAIITDDDLKNYDAALDLYNQYMAGITPKKSAWKLDKVYDWGRTDEVRYRIGNLQYLHKRKPLAAVKAFADLLAAYPDSYWAEQGLRDTIKIQRNDLDDRKAAQTSMKLFIERFPESKTSQEYRKELFGQIMTEGRSAEALTILRSFLDHSKPSDKDYLEMKRTWRDLAFHLREEKIREQLKISGPRDRFALYEELVPVLALASGSTPLENLVTELSEDETIGDTGRWQLTYQIGQNLYLDFPTKAKELLTKLAETSSGTARLACMLTLGNIAYRIDKSMPDTLKWYEPALTMTTALDPWLELPMYRLGRIYLAMGEGIKGITQLELFCRRFPHSRMLARAYLTLAEAFLALRQPEHAKRYALRAGRLSPKLGERAKKLFGEAEKGEDSQQYLQRRLREYKERVSAGADKKAGATDSALLGTDGKKAAGSENLADVMSAGNASETLRLLDQIEPAQVYERYLEMVTRPGSNPEIMVSMLLSILKREANTPLAGKALRHYLSWRIFRAPNHKDFITEAQNLLTRQNYPAGFGELLFRLAQIKDLSRRDFEGANKSYFEYLSFYEDGPRVLRVRERIPQVYEKAKDTKNGLRFYTKLIEDSIIPAEMKVEASIRKAKMEDADQRKEEATRTLEAALAFDSQRKPEIFLRLERLTDNVEYVRRALDASGSDTPRLLALKRLVKKAEEDQRFSTAEEYLKDHQKSFSDPDALTWIARKKVDLSQRGTITDIEQKLEMFPEEPETPSRLFRLANMVEGMENTKYRSQDLFYELTLVYPRSEFFRESKIRADNNRAVNIITDMDAVLKKGVKEGEGDEILLERARLYRDALQNPTRAQEDYSALLKLYPSSPRRDEAYLGLGEIALQVDKDADQAYQLWEAGLRASRDPANRQELSKRINDLKQFRERVLYSEKADDHEKGEQLIFRIWRGDRDPEQALGLLEDGLRKLENRPQFARFQYLIGRIHEESGRDTAALEAYTKALRSLNHPGCRKDRLFYRMARLQRRLNNNDEAYSLFVALISRYPQSLYCRSALYWLYKEDLAAKRLTQAHFRIEKLLAFRALAPLHRTALRALEKDVAARMNLEGMDRLQNLSPAASRPSFHYYIAKVLENDLRDYDRAIIEYEKYLLSNPPVSRSQAVLRKMADLAERKSDYIRAITYLDTLRKTLKPAPENLDLILRIGGLVEDRLGNPELLNLFYETIASEYHEVPSVRRFALAKIRRITEKKEAKVAKPRPGRKVKREYTEDDQEILDEIQAIKDSEIDDKQDFIKAEKLLVVLWDDNQESAATLDIMRTLVKLNEEKLMDPEKAAEYYERWLDENQNDLEYDVTMMQLYELYMDKVKDGQKALRLLDTFIRNNPNSPMTMEAEIKLGKANELLVRNWDEARRVYQRLIDTRQNNPLVHEAYYRMGFVLREGFADYVNSIRLWEEMNALFYNNSFAADAQFAIGYTYEAYQRDYAKARESYERLLNLYPNSPMQNQVREALLRISNKK